MYCLDANVLVRCIAQDEKAQSPRALAFLKKALSGAEGVYIPEVVLMETAWVLQKLYQFKPADICAALEPLLVHAKVRLDHPERVQRALALYGSRSLSIVDAYLAAVPAESSTMLLVTFDRQLQPLAVRFVEP